MAERPAKGPSSDARLSHAVDELRKTLSPRRSLPYSFLNGVCYGIGVITAAVVLVPVIIMMLRSVNWPPIVASFMNDVVENMEKR